MNALLPVTTRRDETPLTDDLMGHYLAVKMLITLVWYEEIGRYFGRSIINNVNAHKSGKEGTPLRGRETKKKEESTL